eukprot:gb/GEZJ01003404.1/.p1 GENE.gb/GEZJ01003404.1/~~gb/GEZJ01003404.1/.p1  ORF type:complete len:143 (-),score=30.02 gb/GEZJ01003404.1/:1672-2100(-)
MSSSQPARSSQTTQEPSPSHAPLVSEPSPAPSNGHSQQPSLNPPPTTLPFPPQPEARTSFPVTRNENHEESPGSPPELQLPIAIAEQNETGSALPNCQDSSPTFDDDDDDDDDDDNERDQEDRPNENANPHPFVFQPFPPAA